MVFSRQTKTLILIVLCILIIGAISQLIVTFSSSRVVAEKTYFAYGEIGNKTGVGINNTHVYFGRIPNYSASQKEINVYNSHDETVQVIAIVSGDIKELVEVRPNYLFLGPGEELTLTAQFSSSNHSKGNYTGYIRIVLMS